MSCSTKIVQDIINTCQSVKGLKPFAYWAYRKDIAFTYSDNVISDVDVVMLGTIQAIKIGLNAGAEEVTYDDNGNGFKHKFNAVINRTYKELDEADDIVVFVKTNSGVWLAYGVENGLYKVSQVKMSNDNLASIAVEFASRDGIEENYSEYVVTADLMAIPNTSEYEQIVGLTIGDGSVTAQQITVEVDIDKTVYVVLPDSTILTSTGGVINTTWAGTAGSITLIIPKVTSGFSISDSAFIGELKTNLATIINAYNCTSLTSLSAPLATNVYAYDCTSLTSLSAPLATIINASNCTSLTSLSAPLATIIYTYNCTSLTSLSAPLATNVYASSCTSLLLAGFIAWAQGVVNAGTIDGTADFAGCGFVLTDVSDSDEYAWLIANGWTLTIDLV